MTALIQSEGDLRVLRALASRIDPGDAGAFNNLGVVYFQKGLFEEAIQQFQKALEIDSKMGVARRNLQIAYHQTGYYDRQIAELIGRLQADPEDGEARFDLAEAYVQTGRIDEAIAQYESLAENSPTDVTVLLRLGNAEKTRGELKLATQWLERVKELDPDRSSVYYSLGEILYNQGMNEEAIANLRKALKLDPELADAHRLLSFIYGEAGDGNLATEHAERAAELNPAAATAQANLSLDRYSSAQYVELTGAEPSPTSEAQDAFAHYTLGIAFRARGLYEEARQEFSRGRDAGEDLTLIGQADAELALLEGDAEGALLRYDDLIETMGDSAKVWNERGVTLHQVGRLEEAEESYKQALAIDDHYALAWNNVGVLSAHRNDMVSAESAFRRALELQPEMDDAQLNLGLLWIKEDTLEQSLEIHEAMLTRDANRADAWNGLGSTLMAMNRVPEARNAFAHAVELNPEFTPARYNLSFALARLGDHDGALRETKAALELDPYYTAPRYRLSIDLQYEGSEVWAPELAAPERVAPRDDAVRDFDFDPAELEDVFKELDAPEQAEEVSEVAAPATEVKAAVDLDAEDVVETDVDVAAAELVEDPAFADTEILAEVLAEAEAEAEAEPEAEIPPHADVVAEVPGEVEPEVVTVSFDAARDYVANGLYDDALAEATRAVREGADRGEGALLIGEVYRLRGLYGEALERFQEARILRPGDPEALAGVALCLLQLDRLEEARDAAEELQPKAGDDLAKLITVGEVLTRSGDAKRAMEVLDVAVQIAPNDPVVHRQLARAALAGGNRRRAKNAYWKAITEDPDYAAARVELGQILIDEGAYAEAEGEIRRALSLMPTYTEASLVLAGLLGRQGRTREMINLVAEVLETEPYNLEALVPLGEALAKEGRHRDAEQAFRRVLHFDPDRPVALFRLGELSAEAGRYKEALNHWRRLFEVDPDSEYAARARVQARVALGLGGASEGAVVEGGG